MLSEELLRRVLHDLRTPVRQSRMAIDWIREEAFTQSQSVPHGPLSDPVRDPLGEPLGVLDRAVASMDVLVEGLAGWFSLAHGPIDPVTISVRERVNDLVTARRHRAPPAWRVEIDGSATVDFDEALFDAILGPVIDNAIDHRQPSRDPELTIVIRSSADGCRLSLSDNGAGFDAAWGRRAFVPLERYPNESEYRGAGMGLAIARLAADRGGASIAIGSLQPCGTRVTVDFVSAVTRPPNSTP